MNDLFMDALPVHSDPFYLQNNPSGRRRASGRVRI